MEPIYSTDIKLFDLISLVLSTAEGKNNEGFRRGGETRVSRWEVEKERKNRGGVRLYIPELLLNP